MEFTLTRNQSISLILNELLNNNYDCMILILKLMNQSEMNDSIHYHNEQSKLRKNNKSLNKFSTYSFLYTIQGHGPSCLLTKTQREEKRRRRKEELLLEKEEKEKKEKENIKKEKGALSYYDDMLSNQTLTEEQRNLFIKMKQKRLNRLKN
tara:strand:+ start:243 stop:695 length:453 start_codon:yes stop_codon:yes gene_type:complete